MAAELSSEQHDDLLRAVERVGSLFTGAGMPRMASRVFAFVLADDADRYTAAQLAEGLRVSPAAISGAVRYLLDNRLLFKEREPGTRADLYRIYDEDVWSTIMGARIPLMAHLEETLDAAITMVGPATPGGRRLAETQEFFRFMLSESLAMMERWREHRHTWTDQAQPSS
ncbi:MAG TPA: helix-turn-helix domain-containing protein [Nocardioidaceae bacterium]|nr:helix-turn-helix domain-containing protein [Nocardioidaceae bacterium]